MPNKDRGILKGNDRGGPPHNGLMPGGSSTQTRCNIGQYGSKKIQPPRDYEMPRASQPKFFEEIMISCYTLDVMVEDHFSKYARRVKNSRGDVVQDALQEKEFEDGINQLGLTWKKRDIQQVFSWIEDAFRNRDKGIIKPEQVDEAVHYEV